MKKLSIIIPVHDRAKLLERCLVSVAAQRYRPLEVVVIDNNSTDNSITVAQDFAIRMNAHGVTVNVIKETRAGAAAARTAGANVATGDVFAFFDSDDTMRPEFSTTVMKPFNENRQTELVFWKRMLHDFNGACRPLPFFRKITLARQIIHSPLSTQSCAVARRLYFLSGGWNSDVLRWNDWEIGIRYLTSLTTPCTPINNCLVDVYAQETSITGKNFIASRGLCEKAISAARQHMESLDNKKNRPLATLLLTYKETILGAMYSRDGDQAAGLKTLKEALQRLPGKYQRLILRMVYEYTRRGRRGAAKWALPLLGIKS